MTSSTPRPDDGGKPLLDLRIRIDSTQRIVSVTLNEVPLEIGQPEPSEPSSAHDCCASREADKPAPSVIQPALEDAAGVACVAPFVGQALGEAEASCALRGQAYLLNLLGYGVLTLFTIIAAQWLIHRYWLAGDDAFLHRYGWWMFYLDVSVVALVATLGYLRSYIYGNANHMVGAMIGMTIGMQVGTMIGGVLGATNGFFIGAIVGMTLGSLYGVVTAWCCGPMAVMHGLMAGVMGGTMGAMVVVMMIPDNVLIFMPVFITVNLLILIWFTYLFYRECVVGDRCPTQKPVSLPNMLGTCLLTIGVLTAIMVAGPKGPMVWKGSKRAVLDGPGMGNPFSMNDGVKPGPADDAATGEMRCGAMMMEPGKNRGNGQQE